MEPPSLAPGARVTAAPYLGLVSLGPRHMPLVADRLTRRFISWASAAGVADRVSSAIVDHLAATIAAAAGVFAGTNVDDLIILTVLFLSSRASGSPREWQIWAGQYTGIAVLIAASAIAAIGLSVVPDRWVGLLGLVPFGLGAWAMAKTIRARADELPSPTIARSMAAVAGVTVANGADNISVYTPLLRTIGLADSLITIAVFAVLVTVWVRSGSWLGSHRKVVATINRYGHWIVPAVFILIGAVILIESGVLTQLAS